MLLSAGAPGERVDVPEAVRPTLPAATSWFGAAGSHRVDALRRRVHRRGEPAHVGYVARPALLAALREEVLQRRPDVVHLFGWGTAALVAHLDGVPAVHDCVDPWAPSVRNRLRRGTPWAGALDRGEAARVAAHEARHYPRCARVVVRSVADAALLPAARTAVVPNGVDLPVDGGPSGDAVVVLSGAWDTGSSADAGRALVTDVLPLLRAGLPGTQALLVGRDPGRDLQRLVARAPGAALTGWVDDVAAALRRGTVAVVPTRTGHGVKNKVLEAMAAGLPVVASTLALRGVVEALPAGQPRPGLVRADTPAEQADAALRWLRDPAAARVAGAANRLLAASWLGWDRSAHALEEVWRAAAREGAPGA